MKIEITNGENNPVTDFFSPTSNTSETDAFLRDLNDYSDVELRAMTEHARKLERERDEARELAQQMSESNQVLQAEVRDYRKTAAKTPLSNNEMHLNLVLQEVAKLAKTLKEERDEARDQLIHLRSCVYDVIHSLKAGAFDELEKAWKEVLK